MTSGSLDVLICDQGPLTFNFDKKDPMETERARRVIEAMLERGYALFIEGRGGRLKRVISFNARTDQYIVAAGAEDGRVKKSTARKGRKKAAPKKQAISMRSAKATAIIP